MQISLIGFMGSGKTSISKLLANNLNLNCIELDELIINNSKFKSISNIFDQKGEDYFRKLENQELEKVILINTNFILSTGGGIIVNKDNLLLLKKTTVIYLETSFDVICKRLKEDRERPLFRDLKKAYQLYLNRLNTYEQISDFQINTSDCNKSKILELILEKIN